MPVVTPAKDHPLRITSEIPRTRAVSSTPKGHAARKAQLAADIEAFLKGGNKIECLPGFPEKVDRFAVTCSDSIGF